MVPERIFGFLPHSIVAKSLKNHSPAPDSMKVLKIGNRYIYLLGVIRGLEADRDKVRKAFIKYKTKAIAISSSEEELEGLRDYLAKRSDSVVGTNLQTIFGIKLSQYGTVRLPPPAFSEAYEIFKDYRIPLLAIDMDKEMYHENFTKNVSGLDYYRHIARMGRLERKKFKEATAEEFVLAWDKHICGLKGFAAVEWNRELHMAERLRELSKEYDSILAVVELERENGIAKKLMN